MREFKKMKMVYLAYSKHHFYFRQHISKFVLEKGAVPLNPFMIFDYFMLDTIDRDVVRNANDNLVKAADEIWIFGPVADGVLAEIMLAKKEGKTVRYFDIVGSKSIIEISKSKVRFEKGLEKYRGDL